MTKTTRRKLDAGAEGKEYASYERRLDDPSSLSLRTHAASQRSFKDLKSAHRPYR
ncbi:hypothetical protein ACVWXQ_000167 [Bradyrhizobium sp. S3.14.4]